jgi:hypothetical protein
LSNKNDLELNLIMAFGNNYNTINNVFKINLSPLRSKRKKPLPILITPLNLKIKYHLSPSKILTTINFITHILYKINNYLQQELKNN